MPTRAERLGTLIERLTNAMTKARESADGQERPGSIILSREAYEALYYAAYDTRNILMLLKTYL